MKQSPRDRLLQDAAWLFEPELGTCIVGSTALAEACQRADQPTPDAKDLDLSWALDIEAGTALLQERGVFQDTTDGSRERGTLALKTGGERLEITTLRASKASDPLPTRIEADLKARDMTVGALAWRLDTDEIVDPTGGLEDWQHGRVVAVGDPAERIKEHPVRWLRYYRRAAQWGFELDTKIRQVDLPSTILKQVPAEALAGEVRSALLECVSPGRWLLELHEKGLLQVLAPELALQFDGRSAGPQRHHPEVSQGLHMILALEWMQARTANLSDIEHQRLAVAVLCHDLGKGYTDSELLPSHHGHEKGGLEPIRSLLDRLPGLADAGGRRLAEAVAVLHTNARQIDTLRPGTRAQLYARWFKQNDFPVRLFALALGADSGGRLGREEEGEELTAKVEADVNWLRERCEAVDAGALWQQFGADKERFETELHQARARALSSYRS